MSKVTDLIDRHIAMWNETEAERRRGLIADLDGSCQLPRPLARGGPALVSGTEFGVVAADGRLAMITGFFDTPASRPQP